MRWAYVCVYMDEALCASALSFSSAREKEKELRLGEKRGFLRFYTKRFFSLKSEEDDNGAGGEGGQISHCAHEFVMHAGELVVRHVERIYIRYDVDLFLLALSCYNCRLSAFFFFRLTGFICCLLFFSILSVRRAIWAGYRDTFLC